MSEIGFVLFSLYNSPYNKIAEYILIPRRI